MYFVRDISSMRYVALRQREKGFISYRNRMNEAISNLRSKYIERALASISPVCFSQEVQAEKLGFFSSKYQVEHMTVEDYAMRNLQKIRSFASNLP